MQTNVKGLCYPLTCLINYRGFRLAAVSLLPVSNSTLVRGSNNGGLNFSDKIPSVSHMMEKAANILKLKTHSIYSFPDDNQEERKLFKIYG